MDPVSSLRSMVPIQVAGAIEGRVEGADSKRGTVTVRLPGGETVTAQGSDLAAGDRVQLAKSNDGSWQARPVGRLDVQTSMDPTLEDWLGSARGADLARAAKSGDPAQVRAILSQVWAEVASTATENLPASLQPASQRNLSPLASLLGAASSSPSAAAFPMALRAESSPGTYAAEVGGRSLELLGPSGLSLGEAGLWTESVVSDIVSLWVPTSVDAASIPDLPAFLSPDASGARRILDRLGVSLPADSSSDPSFQSLVRTLARASDLLGGGSGAAGASGTLESAITRNMLTGSVVGNAAGPLSAAPQGSSANPTATPTNSPGNPPIESGNVSRPVLENPPVEPPRPEAEGSGRASRDQTSGGNANRSDSSNAAVVARTSGVVLTAVESRKIALEMIKPQLADSLETSGASQSVRTNANPPPTSPFGNPPVESLDPSTRLKAAQLGTATVETSGSEKGRMEAAVGHVADSESKSVLTDDSSQAHPASTRHPDLPASTALRVALAWALSNGEPSQAVLKSAVGVAQDLPDALHRLAKALETGSDRFPQVASFLAKSDPESPLLPKHLGLDAPRQNLVPDAAVGRNLSSAIVEDLGQALKQGRSEDAQVLREALNSLVSEGFDGARDPANPMASAPWTMPPRQDRPDSGRVVVHDRRRKGEDASNRTVVDVSMTPTGLGAVDARLELKGQDLNVEFRAREADTVAKLRGGLPELRQILTQLGFDTKDLDVKLGRKSPAKPAGTARSGGSGLDIRA